MNFFPTISIVCSIISLLLGRYVYIQNKKSPLNRIFAILSMFLAYTGFMEHLYFMSDNPETVYKLMKMNCLLPIFLAITFHFILIFTEKTKILNNKLTYVLLYGTALIVSMAYIFTDIFLYKIFRESWGYVVIADKDSLVYKIVNLWIMIIALSPFIMILQYYLTVTDQKKKNQAKYLTIGLFFPIMNGCITKGLLPFFNINIPETDILSSCIMTICIWYAIKKYKLFILSPRFFAENVISTMSESLVIFLPEGKMVKINQSLQNLLRYKEDELIDKDIDMLFFNEDDFRLNINPKLQKDRLVKNYETRYKSRSGKGVHVNISISSLTDNKGKVIGFASIATDITERKKSELEKERLQLELFHSQKIEAIGTLAAGIAHDFNNVLSSIIGYTALLKRDISDKEHYEDLNEIDNLVERASKLTQQLLLFSRKQSISFAKININFIIDNILKLLRRFIDENIHISTNLDPQLWTVKADAGSIEQIIINLTVNSRDAMTHGGKLVIKTENFKIEANQTDFPKEIIPGSYVCLSISDTGTGIDPKTKEHIFEPFFTTKEMCKSSGLGLPVVYEIVKQHKGYIDINSKTGYGTTITIYLPSISDKADNFVRNIHQLKDIDGENGRILMVEDEVMLLKSISKLLTKNGYIVFKSPSAHEAIEIFDRENGDFKLIFSDVMLPDMDGVKLVEKLLAKKPGIEILLASGYTDEKSQWSKIQEKKYRFIKKPYNINELLQLIKDIIK